MYMVGKQDSPHQVRQVQATRDVYLDSGWSLDEVVADKGETRFTGIVDSLLLDVSEACTHQESSM